MKNVYASVPSFENEKYFLRFVQSDDANNLLEVYSDKNALPFFNSDNCHGDNFYYPTLEKMKDAIDFWLKSYDSKWFVRWAIIDKNSNKAIGTIELFHREADDFFNHTGILRLDLKSNYEEADDIKSIVELIKDAAFSLFETDRIATKIPNYAIERTTAFTELGFNKTEEFLIGTMDGYAYKDYWICDK